MPECKQCNQAFEIVNDDLAFYKKIEVPTPTHCPDCREQRRLSARNERVLYARQCDLCNKAIISIYDKDVVFPVYCPDCWWSDKWDPTQFALDYNFDKSYFDQYQEFSNQIPHISLMNKRPQNSDFVNDTNGVKNCYLVFGTDISENSFYGSDSIKMNNCIDFYWCGQCEQCYEGLDNANCYNSHFCQFSENLTDCWFCYDCAGLQKCFGCCGLHHKQYYIFNEEYSEEEYNKKIEAYQLNTPAGIAKAKQDYEAFLLKYPRRFASAVKCENCTGDIMVNCADSQIAFDVNETKNVKYAYSAYKIKDAYDISLSGLDSSELLYECLSCMNKDYKVLFSIFCWYSNHIQYSQYCFNSQDCFGCYGLKKAKYFIFNKEHEEGEFKALQQKIIEQMKANQEYGEFWPVEKSVFAYNETVAQAFFPLNKEQVKAKGWRWKEKPTKPVDQVLPVCEECKQNFKLIPQEIEFYKKVNLPQPSKCPDCRHKDRMRKKNPRKLYNRQCMCELDIHEHEGRCTNRFETTYDPDRPEIIYCEKCYQKEVY